MTGEQVRLLVLGAPRSGTTLVTAMLACHPEIAMLNEDLNGSIRLLLSKRVVGNKLCLPNQIGLRPPGRWLGAARRFYFRHQTVRKLARRLGLGWWNPMSRVPLDGYLRMPGSRVLGILRHPGAVIPSIMRRGGQPGWVARQRWNQAVEILANLRQTIPDRFILLSFEELLENPPVVLDQVLERLGCGYDPRVLFGFAHTRNYQNTGLDRAKIVPEWSDRQCDGLRNWSLYQDLRRQAIGGQRDS